MVSDDLRARVAKALRLRLSQVHAVGTVLAPTAAVDYIGMTEFDLADAVMALLDAEVDAVAERGAAVIAALGADVRATRAERDRFRAAWQSARQRARAYGEGIVRHVEDRDAYKGWMDEQAERASRVEQELTAVRAMLAKRDRRIEEYRESRRRWMEAAYSDRRASSAVGEQLNAALAALEEVREAQSLGEALAAVAKHDGLTRELITNPPTSEESR